MKTDKFLTLAFACLCIFPAVIAAESPGKLGNILEGLMPGSQQEEFLRPDEAFRLNAEVLDSQHILLHWDIADGYYLYRDRFSFTVNTPGIELAGQSLPPGKLKSDPEFGDVYVFYHDVAANLSLKAQPDAGQVEMTVVSQGCKEDAICYPPQSQQVVLQLPSADVAAGEYSINKKPGSAGSSLFQSPQDRISQGLQEKNLLVNMLVFFGFGVLLSFTPCIFPMIPILSGIIVGHGRTISARLAFVLSLTYVIMMALTYAVLGAIAGSFYFNLQAASQNAWAISIFSLIFVLLAFSMFGFYELQLPHKWQDRLNQLGKRQKSGSLLGAGIMGVLSAIIVGPCVAPPLAGALIYISQTGNALLGGAALFSLGMGLGVLLLVIGTSAGKLLPRAGAWMESVRHIFGVLMLAVAIWFMGRILPGSLTLFLWGLLLTITATYTGAFERIDSASGWQKLRKGFSVVLMVYGLSMIIGAAAGSEDVFRPLQWPGSETKVSPGLPFAGIKSGQDLDDVLENTIGKNRVVMLDFYAEWCITCKEMERYTFSQPGVQSVLSDVKLLKADVTANDAVDQALMQRFDIFGPPAILFFVDGKEQQAFRLVGFVPAEEFIRHLQQVKSL